MKYNDNGTYKDIYVKTFDTLPVGAIVEYSGSTIPSGWTDIGNNKIQKTSQYIEGGATILDVYPIGSIYLSVSNTNPATLFGGTWEQIQDRFLLSAGSTYTAGNTGGSANHLHKTGIGHAANYLIFDTKNHSETTSSVGYNTVPSTSGVGTTSVVDLYSEMQTNSVSNLPPYLVVYMWKRTA